MASCVSSVCPRYICVHSCTAKSVGTCSTKFKYHWLVPWGGGRDLALFVHIFASVYIFASVHIFAIIRFTVHDRYLVLEYPVPGIFPNFCIRYQVLVPGTRYLSWTVKRIIAKMWTDAKMHEKMWTDAKMWTKSANSHSPPSHVSSTTFEWPSEY